MTEEWRDIKGHEGKYQVSNMGRVRSLDALVYSEYSDGRYVRPYLKKGRIMKLITRKDGYQNVPLSGKKHSVHRLVAMAFVPGYKEGLVVNHKDENPSNNHADNLEWVTYQYNNTYGENMSFEKRKQRGVDVRGRAVLQYSLDGKLIARFEANPMPQGV